MNGFTQGAALAMLYVITLTQLNSCSQQVSIARSLATIAEKESTP